MLMFMWSKIHRSSSFLHDDNRSGSVENAKIIYLVEFFFFFENSTDNQILKENGQYTQLKMFWEF